jgi:RimJ/RimL family protein N-acetyltransferase
MATLDTPEMPISVEIGELDAYEAGDLPDLCDATEAAIHAGGGFGWLTPPTRDTLEAYWSGIMMIPQKHLFVGRLDGVIGGSIQLSVPARNNEAQALVGTFSTNFVAPWARGHGIAKGLIVTAEAKAKSLGLKVVTLDVRNTQEAAIKLYDSLGYRCWGANPHYAFIGDKWVGGLYYTKDISK